MKVEKGEFARVFSILMPAPVNENKSCTKVANTEKSFVNIWGIFPDERINWKQQKKHRVNDKIAIKILEL
jgi:hypothetical protein